MSDAARKVYVSLSLFFSIILIGTIGYMILSGEGPFTSLYMTVITISTVGFEEILELDEAGRAFTIFVVIAGLASLTLLNVTIVAFLVEGEFKELFDKRRMSKRIAKMNDHFIICGLGQAGQSVLSEFMSVNAPVVIIEKNSEVVEMIKEKYSGLNVVNGDATMDDLLVDAGVERAAGLIAATESDADNLFIVLSARSKNQDMVITARATRQASFNKLRIAGANHVVMPNVIGGTRMAATLLRPSVVNFIDVMIRGTDEETLRMEQAEVPHDSPLVGKLLSEAAIPQKTGLLVVAIKHHSGEYTFNPTSTEKIQGGDVLIVLGRPQKMSALKKLIESNA